MDLARTRSTARPPRRGFVMVTMILSLVALLSFLGLAIDVGYEEYVKTRMQTAADAAAIGGAEELRANGAANIVTAARTDAATNGFTDGQSSVTVTVNNPPATGFSTTDTNAVEVLIQKDVPTFFLSLLGLNSGRVQARSVARLGDGSSCVYALDPAASNALAASGGVGVQLNCGLMVNSSNSGAMSVTGGTNITATFMGVVGGYSTSGGSKLNPTPVTGVLPETDPFSRLPRPTVGACDVNNYGISGGGSDDLSPGTYCKGIKITGGSTVHLKPGTYIIKGGGLAISGGSTLSGSGVTIYNTYASGYGYQGISFSGGTIVNLSAPTSGPYAGILLYQDPSLSSGGSTSVTGGAGMVLNGAIYFPTTDVAYAGGTVGEYTIIVAKTVSFTGGSTINSNYKSLDKGSPIRGSAMVSE